MERGKVGRRAVGMKSREGVRGTDAVISWWRIELVETLTVFLSLCFSLRIRRKRCFSTQEIV